VGGALAASHLEKISAAGGRLEIFPRLGAWGRIGFARRQRLEGTVRTSDRCVSAAKQHPHRPGTAPALGLRAGR